MSDVIFLSNVRLSFPHIAEPQKQINAQTGKERISYNCEFIMPQDHAGFQQFMAKYGELALAKWAEHAQTVMGMIEVGLLEFTETIHGLPSQTIKVKGDNE